MTDSILYFVGVAVAKRFYDFCHKIKRREMKSPQKLLKFCRNEKLCEAQDGAVDNPQDVYHAQYYGFTYGYSVSASNPDGPAFASIWREGKGKTEYACSADCLNTEVAESWLEGVAQDFKAMHDEYLHYHPEQP